MYQKILLATDGSTHALKAAEAARELAALIPGAEVTVLHVLTLTPELTTELQHELASDTVTFEEALAGKAQPVLDRTLAVLREKDIRVRTRFEVGHAAEKIAETANADGYDLVVIGSRGLGNWQEILLGSVSEKVCHAVHIPILIVK
ncbi:MAG TPA: universal stress protein [Clostridia bacterium]|nr:universal stress protein [Clostridia bacterium]